MKEINYQDRFEDVLFEEGLEGKICKIFLIGGLVIRDKVKTVEKYCIKLKGITGEDILVRPESVIILIKEIEEGTGYAT